MEDIKIKNSILEKILDSPDFSHAERYRDLLKYLFEASIKGIQLKQTTIAIDFFGKDSNFIPGEDPIVRVYIGNLRKKLDHFYLTEGKNEKARLSIPKGHYDVIFTEYHDKKIPLPKTPKRLLINGVFLIIILLLSIFIIHLWNGNKELTNKYQIVKNNNPIWAEILTNNKPIIIVLGDYFFLYQSRETSNYKAYIRYGEINSIKDYNQYIKTYPEMGKKISPLNFTYLRPSISLSLTEIIPILKSSGNDITVKLASELTWADINNHNVIYIGSFKTTYILDEILNSNNVDIQVRPPKLIISSSKQESQTTFVADLPDQGQRHLDYGLLVKTKASADNIIMFVLGFDEVGIMASTKKLTDPGLITLLENDYQNNKIQKPFYFKIVLETQGFRRTEFTSDIKYFEQINP